ncbi:filamentous hemagglutinin N-terminal domain-containing protein [Moorena sp. SIO4G3]|uniref:two-partner secretion domain-containing protein n=1 Tax=Moorena sp. SIO4G3 TaxID=2607821 RepID=UPI00142950FA|nr:filamentous hemagglutinin N-terminal domain-containing protein [Moorena sp. SIO4G3]NEO81165.1 filamentous hemagglutinin N-terminal domain-containing protein [Moorena sp. SIO4G3]
MALDVLKRYNTQLGLALCLAISGAYAFSVNQANAQITPDATLPQGETSQLDLGSGEVNGKIVDLIKGGAIRDINLFHSFLEFNIDKGQRVYFANPAGIQNILSRVTGANPSNILGTLGVDGGANLFLINPKGIFFGDKAKLDVSGSFVGTTADGIGFGNRGVFSASNPEPPSPLLTVNPNVFFFNQIPGKITSQAKLEKLAVDNLLLLGGDIEVSKKDKKKDSKISTNQGGNILLAGLGAPGEVALTQEGDKLGLEFPDGVKKGNVVIKDSAIETSVAKDSTVDGGDIRIIADSLEVETSNKDQGIFTITKGNSKKGGDIIVTADSSVKVTTNNDGGKKANQGIFTKTQESGGAGGKISITADLISVSTSKQTRKKSKVEEDQGIFTKTAAVGSDGGEIILTADRLEVSVFANKKNYENDAEDQGILTKTTEQAGNGGKITINAGSVLVTSNRFRAKLKKQTEEGIFTKTEKKAGIGGDIEINVTGDVLLTNKGTIKTKTTSSGQGGTIEINAPNGNVTLNDRSRIQALTRAQISKEATGNGGETIIKAGGAVELRFNSKIENTAQRESTGSSGGIEITAKSLLLDSREDPSNSKSSRGQVQITAKTDPNTKGNGGPIDIRVESLTMIGPGEKGSSGITANTSGAGNAGAITIIVEGNFIMEDRAKIEAKSQQGATGDGNDIIIDAGSLSLSNTSFITAETKKDKSKIKNVGNPGKIQITVKDKIEIIGLDSGIRTQVTKDAGNNQTREEDAGNITIKARSLSLKDGGRLEAFTKGKIKAGDIIVDAKDFVEISGIGEKKEKKEIKTEKSGIFTQTRNGAKAEGGLIQIETPSLRLSDGAVLNAQSQSDFAGGDIKIDADEVQLTDGAQITAASEKSAENQGGNIILNVDSLTVSNSEISASTERGTAGNVEVKAKDSVLLTGTLPNKSKSPAGIFAQATKGGTAQDVTIKTDELTVKDGARIAVSGVPLTDSGFPDSDVKQSKRGEAGKLEIKAESLTLDNGQLIAATGKNPNNNEDAATIDINVPGVIILDNNSLILADATGDKVKGGNIKISGGVLVALPLNNDDKGSDIFANAQLGDGGNIKITLQGLFNLNVLGDTSAFIDPSGKIDPSLAFQNNNSEIAALSFSGGQSGSVTRDITNSAQDPEILPTSLVDPSSLILANCPRSGKVTVDELGEFIVTGRGGLPPSPLDPITQRSVLVDWVTIDTEEDEEETIKEATSTPTPEVSYLPMRGKRRVASTPTPARPKKKIVEAQGWTVGEDGTIILTAEPNNGTPKSNWYSPRSCGSKG